MEVLLRENIAKLGKRGDVVTVRDGYARNLLLPKGMAIRVRRGDLKVIEEERKRLAKIALKERLEKEELAERLKDASVTIAAAATEEGHLFGSVGPEEVAQALTKEVTPVEPGAVRMEAHIKELGVYDVTVHVSQDLEVAVKVWVIAQ